VSLEKEKREEAKLARLLAEAKLEEELALEEKKKQEILEA
jgi:hypothetical protein